MAASLKQALLEQVDRLTRKPLTRLLPERYDRLMAYGAFNA